MVRLLTVISRYCSSTFRQTFHSTAAVKTSSLNRNLQELELKGFTVVDNVLAEGEIKQLQKDYESIKELATNIMQTTPESPRVFYENDVETRSAYWKTSKGELILQAGRGRFDLYRGFNLGVFNSDMVSNNKKVGILIERLLVSDYTGYNGIILSSPGAEAQYWHRDTDTLSNTGTDGSKLVMNDDFYFTCLFPITVPLTLENGSTEFVVGSHRRPAYSFDALESARIEVPVGSALLFNGKSNHRGGANLSNAERPVVYKVYHKKWYNDMFRKGVDMSIQQDDHAMSNQLPRCLSTNEDNYVKLSETAQGNGLFANKAYSAGSVVLTLSGEVLNRPTKYSVHIGNGEHIEDDGVGINMNHSFTPTTCIQGRNVVALVDIVAGDEITFDYNSTELEMTAPFEVDGVLVAGSICSKKGGSVPACERPAVR